MSVFYDNKSLGSLDREFDEESTSGEEALAPGNLEKPSLSLLALAVVAVFTLVGTLFYSQLVKGGSNFLLAEKNRIRLSRVPAPRGIVFDRNNEPLVRNVALYQLVIHRSDLPVDRKHREEVIKRVSQIVGVEFSTLEKEIINSQKKEEEFILKDRLTQDEALDYQTKITDLAGVEVAKLPIRSYNSSFGLAHILGYVGKPDEKFLNAHPDYLADSLVGKADVELVYEQFLKGKDGQKQTEVDALGRLQRVLNNVSPRQGNNLVLSIDIYLQEVIYNALSEALANSGSSKGAAVAINPKTGEIYATVSLPSFDNNIFISGEPKAIQDIFSSPNQPLIDRVIGGVYPSGSTIKPLWAASALQERLINESFKIDTPPEISIGEFIFPDWKDHGITDIKTAIAESNNIFFYGLAGGWGQIKGLGVNKLVDYMKRFGFGEPTGIDLTGEQSGFVPTPEWKKRVKKEPWYIGDTYHLGIGQGDINVTPIQLLSAQSAIFGGGDIPQPHVMAKVLDPDGNELQIFEPKPLKQNVFDEYSRGITAQGMRQAVTSGSARSLVELKDKSGLPVAAAGKTGTAQFGNEGKTHAWFVGFAPYPDPNIGIIVIVEGGGEGHATALPVAKKALEWWFNH